jgi:hypothetical protein
MAAAKAAGATQDESKRSNRYSALSPDVALDTTSCRHSLDKVAYRTAASRGHHVAQQLVGVRYCISARQTTAPDLLALVWSENLTTAQDVAPRKWFANRAGQRSGGNC